MTSFDPRALRNAFGSFMTGVTVVTAHGKDGEPIGFTANSFTSVSLDPPMVLVCLAKTSGNYDALVTADGFAVNILAETQIDVSNTFARPVEDRFATVDWKNGPHGSPVLAGVSAWFDCAMHKTVEAGDHVILIGTVMGFAHSAYPGLGYASGAYVTPTMTAEALAQNGSLVVSALIERDGEVLLIKDENGGLSLPKAVVTDQGTTAAVQGLIDAAGVTAQPGFIYSVYEEEGRKRHHIAFLCSAAQGTPVHGMFVPLTATALGAVSDPAVSAMLERLGREASIGSFGIYYGNQNSGEVRPIA